MRLWYDTVSQVRTSITLTVFTSRYSTSMALTVPLPYLVQQVLDQNDDGRVLSGIRSRIANHLPHFVSLIKDLFFFRHNVSLLIFMVRVEKL